MSAESFVKNKLAFELLEATPGIRIQAFVKGRKRIDLALGQVYEHYDWASLTKIVFGVSLVMDYSEQGLLNLKSRIVEHLPWFPSQSTEVQHLLTHSAGLTWWLPFYKKIKNKKTTEQKWQYIEGVIAKSERPRLGGASVYSDLDFLVLGSLLKVCGEQDLLALWQNQVSRWDMPTTHFCVNNKPKYKKQTYAPTENCPWRQKTLQGEVHDDNTWALGGVAAHAGLFGSIDDLSWWGLQLRQGWIADQPNAIAHPKVIKRFCTRGIAKKKGDWAYGLMMPSMQNASCGRYFSRRSVGHTGFTGTSLWLDPKKDLLVVILSNRVHPTRENRRFVQLRPRIHEWVVEALK